MSGAVCFQRLKMRSSFRDCIFVLSAAAAALTLVGGQQYDFKAEFTRQCLVPDPVGLLDCVVKKVTLPYLSSWTSCVKSLGENVNTLPEIISHRCRTIWEGKGIMPEIFFIRDCVIEKIGLPAKNVSTEILGAYNECEKPTGGNSQSVKGNTGGNRITQESVKLSDVKTQSIQRVGPPPTTRQYFALYPMPPNPPTQSNTGTTVQQQQIQQQQQILSQQPSPQLPQNYLQQQQIQQTIPQQQSLGQQKQFATQQNVPQQYIQQQFNQQQQNPPQNYASQQQFFAQQQQRQQQQYFAQQQNFNTQQKQPIQQVTVQPRTMSQVQYVQQQDRSQQQYGASQNVPPQPLQYAPQPLQYAPQPLQYAPQPLQFVQQSQVPYQQTNVKANVVQKKIVQQSNVPLQFSKQQQPIVQSQQKTIQEADFQQQKFAQSYEQQYSKSKISQNSKKEVKTFSQPIVQQSSSFSVIPPQETFESSSYKSSMSYKAPPSGGVYSYSFSTNHPVRKVK